MKSEPKDLVLSLKRKWFEQIRDGVKPFEYRLNNEFWQKRLIGKKYRNVIFTLGYPPKHDKSRRIIKPWLGYQIKTIVSEEWYNVPQNCFAIKVAN